MDFSIGPTHLDKRLDLSCATTKGVVSTLAMSCMVETSILKRGFAPGNQKGQETHRKISHQNATVAVATNERILWINNDLWLVDAFLG